MLTIGEATVRAAWAWHQPDASHLTDLGDALVEALETARDSRLSIAEEQEKLRAQPLRDGTEIERNARDYLIDLVAWQLNRAADIAEDRLRHFETLRTTDAIKRELSRCADGVAGTIHWFKYYAWGFDPRSDAPLQVQPFALFPFQERYIKWIERLTFDLRAAGLLEKMRDAGATVAFINWTVKQWRFRGGFSAMLTSATEDLIDSKSDPDTLFEKARFQIRLMPTWMLPNGFDLDKGLTYMNIPNPANGSVITGAAPTKRVGRQRRRTVVLMDEFASWPHGGYPQYTALSQTCKSLFAVATPEGRHNMYAQWRHTAGANVFTVDWQEHPYKDKRWFDSLPYGYCGAPMSPEQVAQEIERNYDASQPGKVFKQWREEYCLVRWSDVVRFYEKYKLGRFFRNADGSYQIPPDWRWARTHDYGQTDAHPWIVTYAAQPRANYPLSDTLFVFASIRIDPTGASVSQAQEQIVKTERALGLRDVHGRMIRKPTLSLNSHEADDVRQTFAKEFGETWAPWKTDYNIGIPQLQQWLELIETQKENPFYSELRGRARIVFVAPDDEYQFVYDDRNSRYFITPSKTAAGFKLLRQEMPAYHYPEEERGKAVKDMRPFKLMDDSIDTLRAIAVLWGPGVEEKTTQEIVDDHMPEQLRSDTLQEQMQQGVLTNERQLATHLQRALVKKRLGVRVDEDGNEHLPGKGVIVLPDFYED